MNKVLKKVGLSAVVATFVFGLAGTSSALIPQDPDNETADITVTSDVFVAPDYLGTSTYKNTESYSYDLDNTTNGPIPNGKSTILYSNSQKGQNGIAHVTSDFTAKGAADATHPNLTTSNKVQYYTDNNMGGSFDTTEKVGYKRCQNEDTRGGAAYCNGNAAGQSVPAAYGNIAGGVNYSVKQAEATTGSSVTAVAYSKGGKYTLLPQFDYNVGVGGLGDSPYASGSVKATMRADITEYDNNTKTRPTTTVSYAQTTTAKGVMTFQKSMHFNSQVRNVSNALKDNFNLVP